MLRLAVAVGLAAASLTPAVLSTAFADQTPEQQQLRITGTYHSNYDDVTLSQDGNRVYGTYVCCGGGTIEGKIIEGRAIRYVWRQPSGWGMGMWKIGKGSLEGTWGTNQSETDGGRWDLQRVTSKPQIAK
jgi:hypothetical protein